MRVGKLKSRDNRNVKISIEYVGESEKSRVGRRDRKTVDKNQKR